MKACLNRKQIVNHAGEPIELYWVDLNKGNSLTLQSTTPIRNSTEMGFFSYDGHQFKVRFLNFKYNREGTFKKGPKEEKVYITYNTTTKEFGIKQRTKFSSVSDTIETAVEDCKSSGQGKKYADCISNAVMSDFNKISKSKAEVVKYRDTISGRLRNYTCEDERLHTTKSIRTYQMNIKKTSYDVNVLLEEPHASIWYVEDFATEAECKELMKYGGPRLQKAMVAGLDGTNQASENRKAQQAAYHEWVGEYRRLPLW